MASSNHSEWLIATTSRVRFRKTLRAHASRAAADHARGYIGLSEELATQRARSAGLTPRVYWRDGRRVGGLDNRESDRVNFFVAKNYVIDAQLF